MTVLNSAELELSSLRWFARYALYPYSWIVVIVFYTAALNGYISLASAPSYLDIVLIITYLIAEQIIPYEKRWVMTWNMLFADIFWLIATGAFTAVVGAGLAYLTITAAGQSNGFASHWPFALQLLVCVLIYDGINYSIHRSMHEWPGKLGPFLWRVHAAHHLPPSVHVLMHAVFHPLNILVNSIFVVALPIWLMGYDQKVVTLFFLINSMHGLISHFNVDVRSGSLNYFFVGTELHRYHHSANVDEAKNYGTIVPWFDLMFGTFVYRPGQPPANLGVSADAGLPRYGQVLEVLKLPFLRG